MLVINHPAFRIPKHSDWEMKEGKDIRTIDSYSKEYNYILISRKDHRRSGVRYINRGSDLSGNVSNFVETEQILTYSDDENFHILSYYQLRGSIPISWNQDPDLSYCPKVTF